MNAKYLIKYLCNIREEILIQTFQSFGKHVNIFVTAQQQPQPQQQNHQNRSWVETK